MSTDLERALSKLRFDEQVLGYSLMTSVGRPFVSFAFPDELFPRVKDSIKLYKSDLRLMTIDTDKGLVVLSPVDDNWILTVLYVPELQLGLAIAKTKNVLRLLEGIELPPPPEEFEDAAEDNLQVLESIAMKAAATESPPESVSTTAAEAPSEPVAVADPPVSVKTVSPESFSVAASTVPERGEAYASALSLESDLYAEMRSAYRNFGFDALMLVDGSKAVAEIADTMFQPIERVSDLLKWAASRSIVIVPIGGEEVEDTADAAMGRFVKCPKFEGDLSKVKGPDTEIVKLCNGSRTPEQIAEQTGVALPKVIQILAKYRKHGMRMIGKTR
jgi:hypothetical protein